MSEPRYRLVVLFFGLFFGATAFQGQAQILNIEKVRIESDSAKDFQGKIETSFNLYNRSITPEQQANFIHLTNSISLRYVPGKHAYIFMNEINYTADRKNEILNFGYSHARVNFWHRQRISMEAYGQYQYDRYRGLSERILAGAAGRIAIFDKEKFSVYFGTGPMYESEKWKHPTEVDSTIHVEFLKLSNYCTVQWTVGENLDLNAILYYQTGYDDAISALRNRMSGTLNFNVKITKLLSFESSFSMSYEDKPIVPISKFIYNFENGLSFNF